LKRLVAIEFFFAFLPIIVTWLFNLDAGYEATTLAATISFPLLTVIVVTTLQVMIVAVAFLTWYLPSYTIGEREIIHRRANLIEDRRLAELRDICCVDTHYGPLGRRLGYGDLLLDAGGDGPMRMRELSDADHYAALLDRQLREQAQYLDRAVERDALAASADLAELRSGGENQFVEFKASLVWDYRRQRANKELYKPVFKNIVAFLKSNGGRLLIGVADDGEVLGLDPDMSTFPRADVDGYENVFNQAFNSMIGVEFRQHVNVSFPQIDDKTICLVEVRPAGEPAFLRLKGDEEFYIRAGNATQPLPVSKAARYIKAHYWETVT
jgi:membrane protein YdbS with pleckstrin-like domain